jgi:hypothetical protein
MRASVKYLNYNERLGRVGCLAKDAAAFCALPFVFFLAAGIGLGGSKERAWQEGMLLNPEKNAYFLSVEKTEQITASSYQRGNTAVGSDSPVVIVREHFVVESADGVYLVERARFVSSPPPRLFIAMQVKFCLEKNKLYILDRDGKEVEMRVLKVSRKGSLAAGR